MALIDEIFATPPASPADIKKVGAPDAAAAAIDNLVSHIIYLSIDLY